MSYTPTRHGNPCLHCDDTKGKCRTHKTGDIHLCVSLAGSRKGEKSQGYIILGDDSTGRWAQLLPETGEEYSSEKIRELRVEQRLQEEKAKRERLADEMPATGRDKHYRDILGQLGLASEDKAGLVRRGYTPEQIARSNIKSVEKWQKLDKIYPGNLPGINSRGDGLLTHSPGYICPITDADGLIVGLQVRKRVLAEGESDRYYFLSKNGNIRLDDQIPLAVFPSNGDRIALVEGVGAKPFLTRERLNVSVIGAAGGQWASSKIHLERALNKLGAKPGDEIIIDPDAGSVGNTGVVQQYMRTSEILRSLNYIPVFAWWGQVNKTFGDIDELEPEQLTEIRYLSVAEFEALCIKWGGLIPSGTGFRCTAPIDFQERIAEAQRKLHTLSYPADLVCDPLKKYLPNLVGKIPTQGVVLLKSPKGSGKSHQIKKIKQHCCGHFEEKTTYPEVPELPLEQLDLLAASKQPLPVPEPIVEKVWNKGLGRNFISINARIALGREQAIRWEFVYIEDADTDGSQEFGGEKLVTQSILENIGEIGLCADSLAKLKYRDWSNTLVVIDEIELVLNHISTSSTCRDKRSEILQVIEDKIKESLDNGGILIGADADITDVTADYLKALAPNYPAFIVKHDFKGDPWEITYYTGKRDMVLSQIEKHLEDPECEPIAVALDNQKEAESLSIHLTRKYPHLAREIEGLIRIDSKVTQQDYGKEFVKRPNESIEKFKPKILIYTPSLGVGCSIDVHHFGHVFGLFFGNLEPSQCRQMLARVRDSVPRTVWAKIRAGNSEDEVTSYLPQDIKKRLFAYHDTAMIPLGQALASAMAEVQASGIDNPEDKDILPVLIESLQKMQGADGSWNNPHIDLYCNQVARRNFSLSQLAVQLRQELIEEGHHITDEEGDETTNAGDAVTAGKEEIKRRDSNLTANAEDISFEDAQELKRKAARTTEEEHKVNKAFLKHDLPELGLTSDFVYKAVHKDNGRWLTQAKLYWHLQNRDALAHKDEKHWKSKLSQFSKGVTCLWDVKTDAPKVEAIIKSGLLNWVKLDDLETEYSSECEGGQQFLSQAIANKKQLKIALGITVKDDSIPIKLANRLLDRIGLKLAYSSRTETTKYYKLDEELATDPDRQAVFDALNLKWEKEKIKMAERKAGQESQRMTNENNILINNRASSGNNKPEELPENHVVEHTTEEWLKPENLVDTAALLEACESAEMIEDVRAAVPSYVLKAASKLLQPSKFIQLKQWVSQLNSVATVQAEVLADTAVLLEACDDIEMLADLRKYSDIPPDAFKVASRRLEANKREQIKQWVLEL
ncbi:MAG: plasmid replication protein, CyRepA1 family, partial [Hassallia sp.]